MVKLFGEIIEILIMSNFREGLNVFQYFIFMYGVCKGLVDTVFKMVDSGYLIWWLVDVVQDVIISEFDCGTLDGIELRVIVESGEVIELLWDRIVGWVIFEDILDLFSGDQIIVVSEVIDEILVSTIEDFGVEKVKICFVLICVVRRGVCVKCYGRDFGTGELVELGFVVGVVVV